MKRLLSGILAVLFSSYCHAQQILTLDDCCRIAVENNKQRKLSEYSVRQAEIQAKNVEADFLPKFSASGGYLYANKDFSMELAPSLAASLNMNNTYFAGIQLEQPIYMGGKILSARRMANIGESIANINKRKTDSDIRIETEEAYWNVIKSEELNLVATRHKFLVSGCYQIQGTCV